MIELGWRSFFVHFLQNHYKNITKHYGRTNAFATDWPTDRPMDRPTDGHSYRDARTHLKMQNVRNWNCFWQGTSLVNLDGSYQHFVFKLNSPFSPYGLGSRLEKGARFLHRGVVWPYKHVSSVFGVIFLVEKFWPLRNPEINPKWSV